MAGDSAITVKVLVKNAFTNDAAGVAILSSTASGYIDASTMDGSKLLIIAASPAAVKRPTLLIKNGGTTGHPYFFSAGEQPDISKLTTAAGNYFAVVETARVSDSAGKIYLTKDTTDTTPLTVTAILLP
jgi:hypothetical protein